MSTLSSDLQSIKQIEDTLTSNKVARFAYTNEAYTQNDADGVTEYNVNNAQNIPVSDANVLKVNDTVLSKGYRSQASSITRMLMNHFLGRISYNLNKVNDNMSSLLSTLQDYYGTANGLATLDENGRIPYSQLPESAMEYLGAWDASTNTPSLSNGKGDKGDLYVCSKGGTVNFGAGNITFLENDRVAYNGSVWQKLASGDVRTVNGVSPEASTGNVQIGYTMNVGDILMRASSTAPSRTLLCNGSEVSKSTYAGLYSVIGDAYGTPSSSSNFVLPNISDADNYLKYYIIYE